MMGPDEVHSVMLACFAVVTCTALGFGYPWIAGLSLLTMIALSVASVVAVEVEP